VEKSDDFPTLPFLLIFLLQIKTNYIFIAQ